VKQTIVIEVNSGLKYIFNRDVPKSEPPLMNVSKIFLLNPLKHYKRIANRLLAEVQWRLRSSYAFMIPFHAIIDPSSNICNIACPLCPTGQRDPSRQRKLLSFEEFKRIIDEIGDYLFSVDFTNWGEPLLNKRIFDMVNYYKRKRELHCRFGINLNIPLTLEECKNLILFRFRSVKRLN
jgi:hypothetical protein